MQPLFETGLACVALPLGIVLACAAGAVLMFALEKRIVGR